MIIWKKEKKRHLKMFGELWTYILGRITLHGPHWEGVCHADELHYLFSPRLWGTKNTLIDTRNILNTPVRGGGFWMCQRWKIPPPFQGFHRYIFRQDFLRANLVIGFHFSHFGFGFYNVVLFNGFLLFLYLIHLTAMSCLQQTGGSFLNGHIRKNCGDVFYKENLNFSWSFL